MEIGQDVQQLYGPAIKRNKNAHKVTEDCSFICLGTRIKMTLKSYSVNISLHIHDILKLFFIYSL